MTRRAPVTAFVVILTTAVAVGCTELLGGLAEGTSRAVPNEAGSADAAVDARRTSPWLDGFAYRIAFAVDVQGSTPLLGFSTRLGLDTKSKIAARKMRDSAADLRVTTGDGRTVVPHWIQSGLGGEATTLWTRLDLQPGSNVVFVYYGNDAAPSVESLSDTFVDGVVRNASFTDGTAPWTVTSPTDGGAGVLQLTGGRAEVSLTRAANEGVGESFVAWCQLMTFPAGQRYRLVFDYEATRIEHARLAVWSGGVDGTPLWHATQGVGLSRGVDTDPIEAGQTIVCLGGTALAAAPFGQRFVAAFTNVRVRVFTDVDAVAGEPGPEEAY